MAGLVATFPSPSTGTIDIGPLTIHMYGITLLVAIVAAIALAGIRWTRRGGDWDLVLRAAVWGVAAGIVGARLYHVVTSHDQLPDHWWGPFAVWEGGLGIWGGILFGCIAGGIVVWRSGESVAPLRGLPRAGAAARAGDRALGELVEPGAVREGDQPSLGARHRPRALPVRLRRPEHGLHRQLPPDLPLRVRLRPRRRRPACCSSSGCSASGRPACSPSTSRSTRSAACSRSSCGSTRRTSSSTSA